MSKGKPEYLMPKYLLLYLAKAKSTSGVNNINATEISNLSIPLFPLREQVIIVEEIESRLSVCDSIEQTVDTVLA